MNTKWLAIAVVAMVSGVSGCASARVVRSDPASVVVSVPDEGNEWPFHYRDEAFKVAKEYVKDPVLISTVRVKVGETVNSSQNTNRQDLGGQDNKPKFGEITSTSNVTSVRDEYEYHLEFRSRQLGNSSPPLPSGQPVGAAGPIIQTGGNQPPPASVGTPRKDNVDPRLPPVVGAPPSSTPGGGFPSTGLSNR